MNNFFRKAVPIFIFLLFAIMLLMHLGLTISGITDVFSRINIDKPNTTDTTTQLYTEDNISYGTMVDKDGFYFYKDGQWQNEFLFGVNMGASEPGIFPGSLSITYDDYYRWFGYIDELGANIVRVYTAQRPQFYSALYNYNQQAEDPIYLIHGVWISEEDINAYNDAFTQDNYILNNVIQDTTDIVDIIHGNTTLPTKKGYASGNYTVDVSQYVAGWILGIEWDPYFVMATNSDNMRRNNYDGTYLYTEGASPFEAFLCEVGDNLVEYETTNYSTQSPVAFSNWVTTDPLQHENNPQSDEDLVSVNAEHIKWHDTYKPGMFASYHVYPYYPDIFNYQEDYINYVDEDGDINPYRAYLQDLKTVHDMPVVISEFGIPSSRGKAHENIHTGQDQGHVNEVDQGNFLLGMFEDIHDEGYAGGIVFSWQDEWFKRTWNTLDYDLAKRRTYWSNTQNNEQFFGLLSFDPGSEESIVYIDGDFDEWADVEPLTTDNDYNLYVQSDEKYVYVMAESTDGSNIEDNDIIIPIDTIDEQGNLAYKDGNASFSMPADFIININGADNSRIMTDTYYDMFYYTYAEQLDMIDSEEIIASHENDDFTNIYMALSFPMTVPDSSAGDESGDLEVDMSYYETGALREGISNPNSDEFDSLADFNLNGDKVEIAIPWMLLNVMDPSSKKIIGDVYTNKRIAQQDVEGFYFGICENNGYAKQMQQYDWAAWEEPSYHERLKSSYYILKEGMRKYVD